MVCATGCGTVCGLECGTACARAAVDTPGDPVSCCGLSKRSCVLLWALQVTLRAALDTLSDPACFCGHSKWPCVSLFLLSQARPILGGRRSALDCGGCSRGGAARRWIGRGCAAGARWRRRWAGGWTSAWRRCGSTTPTSAASWTWPARWRSTPSATAPASGYVRAPAPPTARPGGGASPRHAPPTAGTPRPPPRCEGGGAGGACRYLPPVYPRRAPGVPRTAAVGTLRSPGSRALGGCRLEEFCHLQWRLGFSLG